MGLTGKTVLVIDDMSDVRKTVKLILESEGIIVFLAENVDEGLALAASKTPHLIITDLTMPEKDGFDFLKEKRKNELLKNIPVIVLSGRNDKASVTEAVALGASDYVLKPIRAGTLLQKARKRLKDQSFLSLQFKTRRPEAEVSLPVEVLKASEIGLQIEASIKLASDETVELSGELLRKLDCGDVMIRTAKSLANPVAQGRYLNDLNFVAIGESIAKRIRKRLKDWK
ncbi:MAG: response regulator [Bdellovibrionota bacterium]